MPDEGAYLLTNVGFSNREEPLLLLQHDGTFVDAMPLGHAFTLTFDMSQRFCTGWRDITRGDRFVCPNTNTVEAKYEQCAACQKRTGFNPAFYHSSTISAQQEARNQEPHMLYLAHFGAGVIKVGISLARRGNGRLLEQGARTAIVLETLPNAQIARQYEAKIAQIPGIIETLQQRKKSDLLASTYDTAIAISELLLTKQIAEEKIGAKFSASEPLNFDAIYFPLEKPDIIHSYDTTDRHLIAGKAVGMLGTVLFCQQGDSLLRFALKKHTGYKATLVKTIEPVETPAQQTSLF